MFRGVYKQSALVRSLYLFIHFRITADAPLQVFRQQTTETVLQT